MNQVYSNNIVLWLRERNLEPFANASSMYKENGSPDDRFKPQNALFYENTDIYYSEHKPNQWWSIDFRRKVGIIGYEISSYCQDSWIYNWDAQISENNEEWKTIDLHRNECGKNFSLNEMYYTRYFRIYGMGKSVYYDDAIAFTFIRFNGIVAALLHS